jgi:O-antigen ligase
MLPEWQGWWATGNVNGQAPIHSDFVIVFVLMGILGYILFALAFYLVLKNRFRELARRDTRGSGVVLQAIAIIAVVALLIYCSDEPYLAYYNHSNVVWLLLLISEVAMKSTIIDRSERRYQTALSRESLLNRPRG